MSNQPIPLPKDLDNDTEEWQKLISSLDSTDVPIELLKYLRVHLVDGSKFLFPIEDWLNDGLDPDTIEDIVLDWFDKFERQVLGSDFIVNLEKVKSEVLPNTDSVLKDLK